MTEIPAEARRITGLGPEIGGKIIFGLQSAYAKQAGQKPMRFVAPASQHRYDLIIDSAGNPSLARLRRALTPPGPLSSPAARTPAI
jgi:hypothetical protein